MLVSKEGMSNVFSPGELIELLRVERIGRALEEAICYRAILLGITKEYALGSVNIREQTSKCKIAAHHDILQITKTRRQEIYLPNQAKYPKAP